MPYQATPTNDAYSAPSTPPVTPPASPEPSTPPKPDAAMQQPSNLAFPGVLPAAEANKKIRIKTNKGDIVIQTSVEMGPNAASNFVYLVKQGFYNGTIFHRVIPGFMIQGGDPTGTGMGGPGYQFQNDEVKNMPTKKIAIQGQTMTAPVYEDGWVAMANAGRNTNGSQFFIMVGDYPLPGDYSVFGKVVEGLDIAHKIADVARNSSDRPNEEVKMVSVTVE
ncbi:peptidylprolyl isomerase [Patescibacteria group bacterium]|nr:peptidylprolyl isomerase [Patescibacteria group bacterium]MBP9710384.1 peptidylprolyl isomerase [Patescibacteria group bacterium]